MSLDLLEIKLCRKKIRKQVFGSIILALLGVWLLSLSTEDINDLHLFNNIFLIRTIGLFSILFFGLCVFVVLKKLRSPKPGLILDERGIFDNSSGLSAGLIQWDEIKGIEKLTIQKQDMIKITVKDPVKYITGNFLQKATKKANYNMCGTPITISALSLEITFDELFKLLLDYKNCYVRDSGIVEK